MTNLAGRAQLVASSKALLAYRGKTAVEAAIALSISRTSMYARLAGEVDFSATDVGVLADWLDVPVAWMYEGLPVGDRTSA